MNKFKTRLYLLFLIIKSISVKSADTPSGSEDEFPVINLDIKSRLSTDQFDVLRFDKFVIYIAKPWYLFKSVSQGKKLIWETNNTNEYSNKVTLSGKGSPNKAVRIHCLDRVKRVYHKSGRNKPWKDITPEPNLEEEKSAEITKQISKSEHDEDDDGIEIREVDLEDEITYDEIKLPIDKKHELERIDRIKYKFKPEDIKLFTTDKNGEMVEMHPHDYTKFENSINNSLTLFFDFDKEKDCLEVKCKGESVWNGKDFDDENKRNPISVIFSLLNDEITLMFKDSLVSYQFGEKWNQTQSKYPEEVELIEFEGNESKTMEIARYWTQLSLEKAIEYVFKPGIFCSEIKHSSTSVWKKNGDSYPKSVVYLENQNFIISFDGKNLIYNHYNGIWYLYNY